MTKTIEFLIITQGFEKNINKFTIDQFRGKLLPNFPAPKNKEYRAYYNIEKNKEKSKCPWGYSRWVTGENGKLKMFDAYWDSSP